MAISETILNRVHDHEQRRLDRFSRFAQLMTVTDRPTDRPRYTQVSRNRQRNKFAVHSAELASSVVNSKLVS